MPAVCLHFHEGFSASVLQCRAEDMVNFQAEKTNADDDEEEAPIISPREVSADMRRNRM